MEGSWIALGVAALALYSLIGGAVYALLVHVFGFDGTAEWEFVPVIYAAVWPVTVMVIVTWALLVLPARRAMELPNEPDIPETESHKPTTF